MKFAKRVWVGFVVLSCVYNAVKGFPHQSTEESDDSSEPEVEVVIVAQTSGASSDVTSGESSRESHELKSREESDRGSVSESDEPNAREDDPILAEDVAKFGEDDSRMADEEARSPVYHPKTPEEPSAAEDAPKATKPEISDKRSPSRVAWFPMLPEIDRPKKPEVDAKSTGEEAKGDRVIEEAAEGTARKEAKTAEDAKVDTKLASRRVPGFPKMAEEDTKTPDEGVARSPVYQPKAAEEEPKIAEEETKGGDEDESDEDDAVVKFPKAGSCPICPKGGGTNDKTESLCPARPEEMTKIEAECAEEFKQWKEMRAKKFAQQTAVDRTSPAPPATEQTTSPSSLPSTATPTLPTTTARAQAVTTPGWIEITRSMETLEPMDLEATTNEITDPLAETMSTTPDSADSSGDRQASAATTTTEEFIPMELEDEDMEMPETDLPPLEPVTTPYPPITTPHWTTTVRQIIPTTRSSRRTGKQKRSSRKIIKKRSCYPATCILRKLNLLDNMGLPSIERIQSFAINMTLDESTNLEQKAVGCVKEINEAMIDASGDIGKKVGCVAQKVITCLNKGLSCPIMKVPQ